MNKATILMIPSWWPTKENPINGTFFKEQMQFLLSDFDFIIYHITSKTTLFKNGVSLIKKEECCGQPEYWFCQNFSIGFKIRNKISKLLTKNDNLYNNKFKKDLSKSLTLISEKFDLIYGVTAQDEAIKCSALSKLTGKPFVLGEHAPFPWPGQIISPEKKVAIEEASQMFIISKDKIRQIMLQNIKLKNMKYVGNLIDENKFTLTPIKHQKKTFLIVAAHSFYKNYDMFIETMNKLTQKTKKDFRVIVAGYNSNKGYSENAKLLEDKLHNSLFADKIELVESVPRSEINELYNRADAFIMTSIQEGQPVSAMEAACCGLPVFSTRCGGVEDYITEENGRITDITDSDLLSDYLKDFLAGKIKFDSNVIRNIAVEKFGCKAFRKNMVDGFNNVLKEMNNE